MFRLILILNLSLAPLFCRADVLASFPTPALAAAPVTAIRAGRLLDVESGRALSNQVILISGGKIQAVGASLEIPDSAKVIDLSKMTVLPVSSIATHTSPISRTPSH